VTFFLRLRGDCFLEEDSTTLERVLNIMTKTQESVKIRDLSDVVDRLRALRHGIRRTPVVVVNGEKYETPDEILQALLTFEPITK